MIDLKEILVANGIAVLAMCFLLSCRRRNRDGFHSEEKIYDIMCLVTFLGAFLETISFLIDGKIFTGGRELNYLTNSLCFAGTVTIDFLWCLYVDLRIYENYKHMLRSAKLVAIPWALELIAIVINMFGTGILFQVSNANIYSRSAGVAIGYFTLLVYFTYSACLVFYSKKEGFNLHFFPLQYFIGPCLVGVVVQFLFYGITSSWVSISMALLFVQMQTYAENLYKDELSGLFNRRYLNGFLDKRISENKGSVLGIMLDVNDFKAINDNFGHNAGDRAICKMGDVLLKSIPDNGVAIRYAGDEFIVLISDSKAGSQPGTTQNAQTGEAASENAKDQLAKLESALNTPLGSEAQARPSTSEEILQATMNEIQARLEQFNASDEEPFSLYVAMGCATLGANDTAESFLKHMDEKMYEEKRKVHLAAAAAEACTACAGNIPCAR